MVDKINKKVAFVTRLKLQNYFSNLSKHQQIRQYKSSVQTLIQGVYSNLYLATVSNMTCPLL